MSRILIHRLLPLAVCLALLTDSALAVEADDPVASLRACRMLLSDNERLDCYDKLADMEVSVAAPEASASDAILPTASLETGVEDPPLDTQVQAPVSAGDLFGLGVEEVKRSYEKTTGGSDLEELRAKVAQIGKIAPNRILVVLDNSQVWRQIDQSNLRLHEGDAILIKKAALGSFKLQKVGSSRMMRVSRDR